MALAKHLVFHPAHGYFTCNYHQYVVLPSCTESHFNDTHTGISSTAERRAILNEVNAISNHHSLKQHYSDFIIFSDNVPQAFPGLKLHPRSHRCSHCSHVTTGSTATKNMKTHLRNKHNLYAATEHTTGSWYTDNTRTVYSQRFFAAAPPEFSELGITRFFEVTVNTPDCAPPLAGSPHIAQEEHATPVLLEPGQPKTQPLPDTDSTMLDDLQAQLEQAEEWAEKERLDRLNQIPDTPSLLTNPWLANTRFLEILSRYPSWSTALAYVKIPNISTEPQLHYLYSTVKSMVRTWQNITTTTSRYTRIQVMQEHHADVPLFPLEPYQNFDLRHAGCLQKVFIFFARTLGRFAAKRERVQVQKNQEESWHQIQHHLDSFTSAFPIVVAEHERTQFNDFEQMCHNFWLSLIQQTTSGDDLELAVIVPVAILSLDGNGAGFRAVYNFATDLSALKKFARFAAIQKYHDDFKPQEETLSLSRETRQDASTTMEEAEMLTQELPSAATMHQRTEDANRAVANDFKQWVWHYLTTEYPTTMNWLITTARYASRFRYGENLDAFVHWDGDTVTVRSIRTTLSQLSSAIWNEYENASSLLCQLTFAHRRDELPSIPWDRIVDEGTKATVGYSAFATTSAPLASGKSFMRLQLIKAVQRNEFKDIAITDLTDPIQSRQYSDRVQEFLGHLLCLVHLTSGQPARGTELLSIQHENTAANGLRNVYLFNGLVAIVPRYHKGYNRDKSLKTVYRFLPREVGTLLVWYLWLIRPFYIMMQHGIPAGLRDRHYKKAISSFIWSEADGTQCTTSKLLSIVIKRATARWMGQEINISTLRHLLIAFGRKIDGKIGEPKELSREEVDEIIDEAEAEAREMQAGHSAETAHNVYAIDISKVFSKKQHLVDAFFKTSTQWHKALQFAAPSKDVELEVDGRKMVDPLHQRLVDRIGLDYDALLRENYGTNARFRGKQKAVLKAVMTGEPVVAYVAGTGSGKSLLFLLPACFPGYGQTIVIVPLAALRSDIVSRCASLRITTTVWKQGDCDETASIILATPENIGNDSFVSFAKRLAATGRLERIVVDEFHYILLPDTSFRPQLRRLSTLTQYATPITLLSATLPHTEQRFAMHLFGFPSDSMVYRESTSRPNIHYEVVELPPTREVSVVDMARYIRQQRATLPKILVYIDSRVTTQALAQELNCDMYHAGMSVDEKSATQLKFISQLEGTLVATSAFSAGVHMDYLPAVFRFGTPDNILTWAQESGRGGRDGSPCVARLILSTGIPDTHFDKAEPCNKQHVSAFVQRNSVTPTCRRKALDAYFDNDQKRTMCRSDEAACDVCARRFYSQASATAVHMESPREVLIANVTQPSSYHEPCTPVRLDTHTLAAPSTPISKNTNSTTFATSSSPPYAVSSHRESFEVFATPIRRIENEQSSATPHALKRAHSQSGKLT